jgi:hypothetical protein
MARSYIIGGQRFYRRSLVKLSADERIALAENDRVVLRRPVEWPLENAVPDFSRAYTDPGGTDIWGPGPYLKVPSHRLGDDFEPVNRVFCPWGYPPDRLRVAHTRTFLRLAAVQLERITPTIWEWLLTIEPWTTADTTPSGDSRHEFKPTRTD